MKTQQISMIMALALLLPLCSSCTKDSIFGRNRHIKVNVIGDEYTKSAAVTTDALKVAGKFVLDAYLDDDYKDFTTEPATEYSAGQYIESSGAYNVHYSAADGWVLNTEKMWVSNDLMRFFCYYPDATALNSAAKGLRTVDAPTAKSDVMEFSYALPTHVEGSDATLQQDLLFAYSQKTYTATSGETVDIQFNHPLSRILFTVSPDDATFDVSLTIKSIVIKNVYPEGDCTFHGLGKIKPAIGEQAMFVWTPGGTKATYSQDYNASFGSLPSGWVQKSYTKNSKTYKLYECTNSFLMIPQTLESGTTLEVTFGNTGTGSDIIVERPIHSTTWLPGHYYTYKIGATTIGRDINMIVILDEWGNFEDKLIIK